MHRTQWAVKSRLLHTRILDTVSPTIQEQMQIQHVQSPASLWQKLNGLYGLSPAEERLVTIKTLINLHPQGNPIAMMRQWESLAAVIQEKGYDAFDICHDIAIILIGNWQRSFVRGQLDEFFADSKNLQYTHMDMHALIDQLEARSTNKLGQYTPLAYPFYRQDPRNDPKGGDSKDLNNEKGNPPKGGKTESNNRPPQSQPSSQAQTPLSRPENRSPLPMMSGGKQLCTHCRRGYHRVDDCWTLYPEKRPPRDDSNTGSANFVACHTPPNWIFDTGASWTICDDQLAFTHYLPLNHMAMVELPDGGTYQVKGVGTIDLLIGDRSIKIQNARYVPDFRARLLSFSGLEKQGFDIRLTSTKPYKFIVRSPDGAAFMASRPTDNDGVFMIHPLDHGLANAVSDVKSPSESSRTRTTPPAGSKATMDEWHHRLSHMNQHDLLYLHRIGRIVIEGKKILTPCDYCFQAKATRKIGNGTTPRTTRPGARLHVDLFGGGKTLGLESDDEVPPANGKFKYVMLITDDATRFRWVFPLLNRDNPTHTIFGHIDWLRNLGLTPAYVRGDNEFFKTPSLWQKKGIKPEPTVPYSPWQDGVSERGIRIVLERTRAVLYASGLPRRFWLECLMDTVNKTNHLPTSVPLFNDPKPNGDILDTTIRKSPFYLPAEAWEGRPVQIAYMRPFGATIWYHRHGTQKPTDKMEPKGSRGILLGHLASNISLVWDPSTDKIQRIADGRVDEGVVSLSKIRTEEKAPIAQALATSETHIDDISDDDGGIELRPAKGLAAYIPNASPIPSPDTPSIPRSYAEVLRRPDKDKWLSAMDREMEKLRDKNVWDLVRQDDLPPGTCAYPGRWVYDIKSELPPDNPKYYKARWVIRGNLLDKDELQYDYCTYAPVISSITTRLFFAIAAYYGWDIRQADVAVAFLNGPLRDTVYVHQPPGYRQGERLVCKLNQSLYGLAPAARIWYDTLVAYLIHIGFRVCNYDPGLFIHTTRRHLYLTTYVDDFKIVAENSADSQWAVDALSARFEIKDMGRMKHYLGMDVDMRPDGIFLGQEAYTNKFINSFGMELSHAHKTPLDSGFQVDDEPDSTLSVREYQRGTGCLQWLATKTRPDITHAACLLAQYNSAPTRKCWNALLHVIRYLRGSLSRGLFYPRRARDSDNDVLPVGYSDSDWAGPHSGRKSIGGFIFLLANSPISWQAKKQTCVATSSNEAEYMAASEAAKEACWLRRVLQDIQLFPEQLDPEHSFPAVALNMDNQGAIALTSTEGTKRSKHIDVRFHHIRDLLKQGVLTIKNVPSREMAADGFTKILRTEPFERFLSLISMGGRDGGS